ncbi:hypothetical protein BKA70DRAFT_1452421 [Coprinopsis sp. MPI-PUGE-AT-0042]|nr:hypothetical protein BKA70DRAFT_1452421 [Coprinopsis sp. MPI-PUGE-AT-0042]
MPHAQSSWQGLSAYRKHAFQDTLPNFYMNTTTNMLVDAQSNGEATPLTTHPASDLTAADGFDCLSPSVEAMLLEENDIDDSDFSSPSGLSEPSSPGTEASAPPMQKGESTGMEESALSKPIASTGSQTEDMEDALIQKHSLYFWESITFKASFSDRTRERCEMTCMIQRGGETRGPVELDVALGDFENFLKAFLPRASAMCDERPALTTNEWVSVLKLSTLWLFNDLRKLAIAHLSSTKMDPIDLICLAKEYRVHDWLQEGYVQVIERLLTFRDFDDTVGMPTTLTALEGKRIGMEVALELSGIAIRRMRQPDRMASLKNVKGDILDVFKEEFDCVLREARQFMTSAERLEDEARKKTESKIQEEKKCKQWKKVKNNGQKKDDDEKVNEMRLEDEASRVSSVTTFSSTSPLATTEISSPSFKVVTPSVFNQSSSLVFLGHPWSACKPALRDAAERDMKSLTEGVRGKAEGNKARRSEGRKHRSDRGVPKGNSEAANQLDAKLIEEQKRFREAITGTFSLLQIRTMSSIEMR